jgi:hypothetical protein
METNQEPIMEQKISKFTSALVVINRTVDKESFYLSLIIDNKVTAIKITQPQMADLVSHGIKIINNSDSL